MLYDIAELKVSYKSMYPMLEERSAKYKVTEIAPAQMELSVSQQTIENLRPSTPLLDDATREYMEIGRQFYLNLISFDGMMLHASAVVVNGEAYLFSAPSGTGKSTHTNLWLEKFGDSAYILNDDKPAIRLMDGKAMAFGTPFSGKFDISRNIGVPIRGIAFLERSAENSCERMEQKQAIYSLMNQSIRPSNQMTYIRLLKVLDSVIRRVPVYTLKCNMDPEAAQVAYETMQKGTI